MHDTSLESDALFLLRVDNRPGALARSASAFHRRGINIRALTVGPGPEPDASRMVIHVSAPDAELQRLAAAIANFVDVLSVDLTAADAIPDHVDCRCPCHRPQRAPGLRASG